MSNNEGNAGDNTGLTREKVEQELGKFGKAFGQGQNSRPAAAILCVDAAHRLQNVGPNDADALYTRFSREAAKSQGIEYSVSASHKVQVSKLKRFLMLGACPGIDPVEFMNDVCDTITELSRRAENPLRGSAYDNMVRLARRQIETPTVQLTKQQIEDALCEGPEEKTELDKVIDTYKKVWTLGEKLREAGIDHEPVVSAAEHMAQQIADMGGDLPAMTKEDRAVEKAKSTLSKHGIPVAQMMVQQPAAEGQSVEAA